MIITIDGTPKSKQSVKASVSHGKIHTYQPASVVDYENYVKIICLQQRPKGFKLYEEPLIMFCQYIFPTLKTFTKKKKQILTDGGYIFKDTKPDVTDNLTKALADALSGIIYNDDARIVAYQGVKYYADEDPKTIITILTLQEFYINGMNWWSKILRNGIRL